MNDPDQRPHFYPAAQINITNKCTLRCNHCFIYRDGNPNDKKNEMDTATLLARLTELKNKHGIINIVWMGGEPLLRPDVLREGAKMFNKNTVTTNGTLDLIELPRATYVVSLDGPPELNDAIRGKGVWERVMKTLSRVPADFGPTVMVQVVVTRTNEDRLEELVELLRPTRVEGMSFSFYVPPANDKSDLTWGTTQRRDRAVRDAMRLKEKYPDFIWNNRRSLELTLSENCGAVTKNCPAKNLVMPIYQEGGEFVHPFCCHGNDVDCELCGSWVVFYLAEKMEGGRR